MTRRRWLRGLAVVAASMALGMVALGCDPIGPGASGVVRLGEGVTAEGFETLEVRIFPATKKDWTIADGVPAEGELHIQRYRLAGLSFPTVYEVSSGVGVSDEQTWRLLVWLSKEPIAGAPSKPATGDPWGNRTFELLPCQGFGGYCNVTSGVDVTLDQAVP